jgi:hypothetical protein
MQHIVEIIGQSVEIAAGQVGGVRSYAGRLDLLPGRPIGEPSDPPHLVGLGERRGQRERDLPGRAGHEDLVTFEHCISSSTAARARAPVR